MVHSSRRSHLFGLSSYWDAVSKLLESYVVRQLWGFAIGCEWTFPIIYFVIWALGMVSQLNFVHLVLSLWSPGNSTWPCCWLDRAVILRILIISWSCRSLTWIKNWLANIHPISAIRDHWWLHSWSDIKGLVLLLVYSLTRLRVHELLILILITNIHSIDSYTTNTSIVSSTTGRILHKVLSVHHIWL